MPLPLPRPRRLAALAAPLLLAPLLVAAPAQAVSPNLVISQVYGGGGNTGATLTNDFIELYNRGSSTVSTAGMSVQYASATGTTWLRTNLPALNVSAGGYVLIQQAQGAGGTTPLPTPHVVGTTALSATAGKVALVASQNVLACGADCDHAAGVVDFVGYGTTANDFEGTGSTAAPSNTTAALRNGNGATDTDDNATDFTVGTPSPRNTGTTLPDTAPSVDSTTPANGASDVAAGTNLTLTFSEPVTLGAGAVGLACSAGDVARTLTGGPTSFTVDPDADLPDGVCTATVSAAEVSDQDADDPPDTMAANYVWSFTVGAEPVLAIHAIQGVNHISPLSGQAVRNVQGIVTARKGNGFWMQDPNPDADDATSEGIFVFTSSAPTAAVGDLVRVDGAVTEFRPGGSAGTNANLTTTELSNVLVTTLSTGNPLPATTTLGIGGRVPPNQVIEDDATGSVETSGTFDPATDGIDFYESMEGMRVQVDDAVATGPTNAFGEIWVVGDNGANASLRTARGGIVIRENDDNPERIQVDDGIPGVATPQVNVGAIFAEPIVGVVDYNFGNFELVPTVAPVVAADTLTREVTRVADADELSVANFNVENLDPGDPQSKFDQLAELVVVNLRSPDLLVLEEIQDNNGPTNDGTVDATATLNQLAATIQAHGGPAYQYRQINPVNNADGGEPGGNIRVGFMFRSDTGLSFVDRPGGDATTAVHVVNGATGPELSVSPGRIEPTNPAFNNSRKPLAGEFMIGGKRLFVVANHFNSKGGDQPLFGRFQPPVLSSEVQRLQQATLVRQFVDQVLGADPEARVIVSGDLNDFEFSAPVETLTAGGALTALVSELAPDERYSYVFEGNSQTLDHVLASDSLADVADFDVVHVNAEFAVQASDHDPSVARFSLRNVAPSIDDVTTGGHASCTTSSSVTVSFDDANADDTHSATVDWGDGSSDTTVPNATSPQTVTHDYALAGSYGVTVTVSDGTTSDSESTTLVVDYTVVGGTFLEPIGSGTTARYGSTTVVKIAYEDCDGSRPADLAPTLRITKGSFERDAGTLAFVNGEYVLNFKTNRLAGRGTYTYTVTVPETGQTTSAPVVLR